MNTTRFHMGEDGIPRKCTAPIDHCPLGGVHYNSKKEAELDYERIMNDQVISKLQKRNADIEKKLQKSRIDHGTLIPEEILEQVNSGAEAVQVGPLLYNRKTIEGKSYGTYWIAKMPAGGYGDVEMKIFTTYSLAGTYNVKGTLGSEFDPYPSQEFFFKETRTSEEADLENAKAMVAVIEKIRENYPMLLEDQ